MALAGTASWMLLRGLTSCGCFGAVQVPPSVTFGVDLVIGIALLALPAQSLASTWGESERNHWIARFAPRVFLSLAACVTLVLFGSSRLPGLAAMRFASIWNDRPVRLLIPEEWLGQQFPLAGEARLSAEIARGKWTVLFYHRGCPRCEATLRSLAGQAKRGVVIDVDVGAAVDGPARRLLPGGWLLRELDPEQTWLVETPAVIELTDGVVSSVGSTLTEG